MQNNPIKIIELQDQYTNQTHEYPYILSIKSKIRFRLRSKLCYDHQAVLLLEKLQTFDYCLPLKGNINITQPKTTENFVVLFGQITKDGGWQCDLPQSTPGVVSFQLAFVPYGSKITTKLGSYDTILLCQDKVDLRKLRKMTVFARCIGKCTQWQSFFRAQKAIGYNAFHFAPIQETGASNSYYSLKNHLDLSSQLFDGTKQQRNAQLVNILDPLKKQGMTFFIDIVLNHTSFDSEWIRFFPNAVFTPLNTPMLCTAYLVDDVIFEWGSEVKQMMSFDVEFTQQILIQIEQNLRNRLVYLKLNQYFELAPEQQAIMLSLLPTSKPSENIFAKDPVQSIEEFLYANVTTPNNTPYGVIIQNLDDWANLRLAYEQNDLKLAIQAFNASWKNKIENEWIPQIVRNTIGNVKHNFLDNSYRSFDDPYPLVNKYFSRVPGVDGDFYALNNGWVGGGNDSRQLFVTSKQYYYLRRRVNSWGDLLRIRYGDQPADSPAAWKHMLQYVREMAKSFDGFRMDNLHGTPLNVARYMIKQARKINPNLIVFAELFTNSDVETAEFVRQIGINSILKEAQHMLSGDGFVYHFHSKINVANPYLGSINRIFIQNGQVVKYAVKKHPISLVYDLTHDNLTYVQKKQIILQVPLAFLLSMTGTFTGSTKGFDQFYSKKIYVTQMKALYQNDFFYPPIIDKSQLQTILITYSGPQICSIFGSWDEWKTPIQLKVDQKTGIKYNTVFLAPGKYQFKFFAEKKWILEQGRANNGTNHVLTVTNQEFARKVYRTLEQLRKSTAEKADKFYNFNQYHVYNIGNVVIVIRQPYDHSQSICAVVNLSSQATYLPNSIQLIGNTVDSQIWVQTDLAIYQGQTTQTEVSYSKNIHQFFDIGVNQKTGNDVLKTPFLPPGFACFIHCHKNNSVRTTINSVEEILSRPINLPPLGPLEINGLFFNCNQQEQHLWGQGAYCIPQANNHQMVYAGFAGAFDMILRAKRSTNLNEGLFRNLRQGNWLFDYYLNRVRRFKHLQSFTQYLQRLFSQMGALPRYLIPKYFSEFIYKLIISVKEKFKGKSDFEKSLVFASYQFINYFPKCSLTDKSLFSAGLPHFSVGWARCWGRDTFTSSDILRLYPNIFRQTILQFASAMRNGLIPNLLDEGNRPRYNCRDACWWFLRAIIQYIQVTNDYEILKNKVEMIFYSSDKLQHQRKKNLQKKRVLLLEEIVQDIFQMHASGISFREWNAGYQIDSNMRNDGFNISLEADPETGFIIGGNPYNCLTWMDKMGSSARAGTKGVPATPRAGSPVQLVGLLYFALTKFEVLSIKGYYSFNGVEYFGKFIKFSQWADKIKQSFQTQYYLEQKENYQNQYVKGIYKDLVGSPLHYDQERFRSNSLIALAVSPQLFTPEKAINHIKKAEKYLLQPKSIGFATLADMHTPYCSFYDNSDDSNDFRIAHGFSYHNGPEWVWLYGFYLVAKINFQSSQLSKRKMMTLLQQHVKYLQRSEWQSLPELTNRNGQANKFSCSAQAWSVSTILMALRKIESLADE